MTDALDWMARLAALATAIAALELLVVRRALADGGVFAWPVLRRELGAGGRALGDRVFGYRGTIAILLLQLASALALPWTAHAAPAWIAFATTLLVAVRFRGTYNGGSDTMLLVVLLALAAARTHAGAAPAALAYAAAQLVLSYFVSGVAKLREPTWLRGQALPKLVRLGQYRVPPSAVSLLSRPAIARAAAWSMLAFECAFPLAFVVPLPFVVAGVAFHTANAFVFGLNRFLWAWLAAYPALLYWS